MDAHGISCTCTYETNGITVGINIENGKNFDRTIYGTFLFVSLHVCVLAHLFNFNCFHPRNIYACCIHHKICHNLVSLDC